MDGNSNITGSLNITDSISASTGSFDTINARLIHTTIESSSVIYSTGSNILGDDASDVQTLNGTVNVPNLHYLSGNPKDTNLRIDEKLDTGSFNSFSSSLHTQQEVQDQRLDSIEAFTSSADNRLNSIELETASLDVRVTDLENFSSSFAGDYVQRTEFNEFTSSVATTGSNTFNGDQTINGRVKGNVTNITITSNTASIDCSQGNFFTLTLPTGNTHLTSTNISEGQTITLRVTTQSGNTITIDTSKVKFALTQDYQPTDGSSTDVLTFVSFDSNALYGASVNTF